MSYNCVYEQYRFRGPFISFSLSIWYQKRVESPLPASASLVPFFATFPNFSCTFPNFPSLSWWFLMVQVPTDPYFLHASDHPRLHLVSRAVKQAWLAHLSPAHLGPRNKRVKRVGPFNPWVKIFQPDPFKISPRS